MITIKKGNIFKERANILVCPTNCKGIMGKGLALAFSKLFPKPCNEYNEYCKIVKVNPGEVYRYNSGSLAIQFENTEIWFANTKDDWKDKSKYEWIESISKEIYNLVIHYKRGQSPIIHIPALGCGLGELEWKKVKEILEDKLKNTNGIVYLFEPL